MVGEGLDFMRVTGTVVGGGSSETVGLPLVVVG